MLLHMRMVEKVDLKSLERDLAADGGDRDEALRERITQAVDRKSVV